MVTLERMKALVTFEKAAIVFPPLAWMVLVIVLFTHLIRESHIEHPDKRHLNIRVLGIVSLPGPPLRGCNKARSAILEWSVSISNWAIGGSTLKGRVPETVTWECSNKVGRKYGDYWKGLLYIEIWRILMCSLFLY